MVATFGGTERDTKLDLERLTHLADYFAAVRKKYAAFEGNVQVDAGAPPPGPGRHDLEPRLSAPRAGRGRQTPQRPLSEIAVRADLGYPPLVTPTSQIVGTQAVLNALFGERYKQVTKETRGLALGQYGQTPAAITDEVRKNSPPTLSQSPRDRPTPSGA